MSTEYKVGYYVSPEGVVSTVQGTVGDAEGLCDAADVPQWVQDKLETLPAGTIVWVVEFVENYLVRNLEVLGSEATQGDVDRYNEILQSVWLDVNPQDADEARLLCEAVLEGKYGEWIGDDE